MNKIQKGRSRFSLRKENNVFYKRTYMTFVMFSILFFAMRYKLVLIVFVYLIKLIAYFEVTEIGNNHTPKKLSSTIISWYLLILSDLWLWREKLLPIFRLLKFIGHTHKEKSFIVFVLYLTSIIFLISMLRKGTLKKQCLDFAVAHFSILMINVPSYCILKNILTAKFWFIYPVLLVSTNDICAYLVGKYLGKTQLIKISPKKTVEGFIGGFIFTVIVGIILTYLKLNSGVFDNGDDKQILTIQVTKWKIPIMYLHAIVFILFSSFLAPFGGLIGSTFKRIFKVKDFSSLLPGHGGITDRIDCQLLMGIFTKYYIRSFIYTRKHTTENVVKNLIESYNHNELKDITIKLLNYLQY